MHRQLHALHSYFYHVSKVPKGLKFDLLRNTDWLWIVKCKAHGGSNSIVHAMKCWDIGETDSDAHVAVEGLRRSATCLHDRIDLFLVQYLTFKTEPSGTVADRFAFWKCFDCEPEVIDELVKLDLVWDGKSLSVDQSVDGPDCWKRVSAALLYLLRWFQWSSTRWGRVARAAKFFLFGPLPVVSKGLCKRVWRMIHSAGFTSTASSIRASSCAATSQWPHWQVR